MKGRFYTSATVVGLALEVLTAPLPAQGQGKGHGEGHDKGGKAEHAQSPGEGQGQGKAKSPSHGQGVHGAPGNGKGRGLITTQQARPSRGASAPMGATRARENDAANRRHANARFTRDLTMSETRPSMRRLVESDKNAEKIAAGAVAHAYARGRNERDFVIAPNGDHVVVRNRKGDLLLDLDENRARNVGQWKVNVLDDRMTGGAPSFCRSGAGHPVWGRQWCIDKGFGLGTTRNLRWGFTNDFDQPIVWRPASTTGTIASDALARVLGTVVTDRLALHAITLGLVDPLVGRWLGEPSGQRVLLVNSGTTPVAEFVDVNHDDLVDRLLVALRSW